MRGRKPNKQRRKNFIEKRKLIEHDRFVDELMRNPALLEIYDFSISRPVLFEKEYNLFEGRSYPTNRIERPDTIDIVILYKRDFGVYRCVLIECCTALKEEYSIGLKDAEKIIRMYLQRLSPDAIRKIGYVFRNTLGLFTPYTLEIEGYVICKGFNKKIDKYKPPNCQSIRSTKIRELEIPRYKAIVPTDAPYLKNIFSQYKP